MADAFMEKFIADLVKGAEHHKRENGGVGVNIVVAADRGHTEKLAGAGGNLLGAQLGAGTAHHSLMDRLKGAQYSGAKTAAATFGLDKTGGIGDALAKGMGHAIGFGVTHPKMIMPAIGAGLGAMTGAERGGPGHRLEGAAKGALVGGGLGYAKNLGTEYLAKNHTNAMMQGLAPHLMPKTAFWGNVLGAIGSLAAPSAAKWGLGQLAGGAGGKMLGGLAGKILPHAMSSGLAGKAFNAGAGMLGGSLGSHLGGAGQAPGQAPGQEQPMNPAMYAVGGLAGGHLGEPYLKGHMPPGYGQGY
jgi:hypothetical protein